MLFYNIPNRTLVFQNAKNRCPFSIYIFVTNRECSIGFFQNSVFQTAQAFGSAKRYEGDVYYKNQYMLQHFP